MTLHNRVRCFSAALAASAVLAFVSPVMAQEITPSHLKAAHAAISAINATDGFDNILPQAASALKAQLIQKNPDQSQLIGATVDQKALALAARRSDLEKEAATAYAKVFSEQALNEIATFYNTETGKKLLSDGPIVSRELVKAADIWQNGIARDLAQQVGEVLQASSKPQAQAPAAGTPEAATPPATQPAPQN